MIQILINAVAGKTVGFGQKATDSLLKGVQLLVKGSLLGTGEGLQILSKAFVYKPEWREALREAGIQIIETGVKTDLHFDKTIQDTYQAFGEALQKVNSTAKWGDNLVFDNRTVSSILGSAHNQKIKLTKIDMSFRKLGEDISLKEAFESYQTSGRTKSVLFLPGLFTDETVWMERTEIKNGTEISTKGIATELEKLSYHPFYLRFNHGLPIHENGKKLMHLLDLFFDLDPNMKPNIVCYSLGGLVFRSCLYHAKLENKPWINRFSKVVSIASPNKGSYLEKFGFWLGFLLEKSPILALKIIGMIGNLRSDSIKDLSFGLIRKEERGPIPTLSGYFSETYFGELEEQDIYQAYGLLDGPQNPFQNFLGDGIVEKQSLTYLTEKVYNLKPNAKDRTLEVLRHNHFTILASDELMDWVLQLFSEKS